MIEGRPFLYQTIGPVVFHVDEKGVEMVQSWSSQEPIVAYIDGDEGDSKPEGFLVCSTVQLVVASPPKGAYKKWTKQTGHATYITKLVTKLWSRKELFLTGLVLSLLSTLD